ncbi:MAG: energy transducer TonB [Pseudobdellovibrionaceae bacterium]
MKNWNFRKTLIVSLLLHLLLMLTTTYLPALFKPQKSEIIEISYQEAPLPPEPKLVQFPEEKKQVVDQDERAINDEIDPKAKFLSANNQVVKKQTVASELGDFKNKKDKVSAQGEGGKPLTAEDLKPKLDFSKMVEKKRHEEEVLEKTLDENALKMAEAQKQQPEKQAPALKPGTGGAEASQTQDYLKDVDKGMETLLSTREFVYYSFYARIRRQLNQHWGGKVREKMMKIVKEGRTIASADDKITKLLITLNRKGHLVKVQVLSDSGIRDLDEAAIEAFKEAAPFPNPPDGIVETDGTIKIRWDFILEA